jgi:hypothetical protein
MAVNATTRFGEDGRTVALIALASWVRQQAEAPNIRIERRPIRHEMKNMPTVTPRKPMQVFMIEYWKDLVTPMTE